jgi:regulator of sigma E protease
MDTVVNLLQTVASIAIIVALFNVIIFVHELGHFLAARWRGLQVDRFQIWFGKPLWKKEVNGVQYGLGWLPFGGFVALPQMAPMESIEGDNRDDKAPLPKVKPIDKIIVALAGPIFSFLLALTAGLIVWNVGKPEDFIHSTEIGYIAKGSPAAEAKLQVGDRILAINGEEVNGFAGSLDSVQERIMLSEGKEIEFRVARPGEPEPLVLRSGFKIADSPWFRRSGMRNVGIGVPNKTIVGPVSEGGPAFKAGLKTGDQILAVNGEKLITRDRFFDLIDDAAGKSFAFEILRKDSVLTLNVTPVVPLNAKDGLAKIGIGFLPGGEVSVEPVYPTPAKQVGDSLRMMWVTIAKIVSKDSDVGPQHLSGPVGIGKAMYDLLLSENGWRRLIWFLVLFNVNLAVLNMLPLPVLDGGHVVLSLGEMIVGKPVKARVLEVVQTAFALVILSFFLFITSKDIGDNFFWGKTEAPKWPTSGAEAQG